jgi:hypothetical protein
VLADRSHLTSEQRDLRTIADRSDSSSEGGSGLALFAGNFLTYSDSWPSSLTPILGHPLPLMFPAVLADTARHIGGIGAMLHVATAGGRQRSLEFCRPLLVGLGEPPDLIGCQL